jgi:hypothetical protein
MNGLLWIKERGRGRHMTVDGKTLVLVRVEKSGQTRSKMKS